jgi:hypothetical protein
MSSKILIHILRNYVNSGQKSKFLFELFKVVDDLPTPRTDALCLMSSNEISDVRVAALEMKLSWGDRLKHMTVSGTVLDSG